MSSWNKAISRTVNATQPTPLKKIKNNSTREALHNFIRLLAKDSKLKGRTKNGEIHKFHRSWEKLISLKAQHQNRPIDSESILMAKDPNPTEIIKTVSNLGPEKIETGSILINPLIRDLMMIFIKILSSKVNLSGLKSNRSKLRKERIHSRWKF